MWSSNVKQEEPEIEVEVNEMSWPHEIFVDIKEEAKTETTIGFQPIVDPLASNENCNRQNKSISFVIPSLEKKKIARMHQIIHCQICLKMFPLERIEKHIKLNHLSTQFVSKSFTRFRCDLCTKYFLTRQNMKDHQRCDSCEINGQVHPEEIFKQETEIDNIERKTEQQFTNARMLRKVVCKICFKTFPLESLNNHIKLNHSSQYVPNSFTKFQCDLCTKYFLSRQMKEHQRCDSCANNGKIYPEKIFKQVTNIADQNAPDDLTLNQIIEFETEDSAPEIKEVKVMLRKFEKKWKSEEMKMFDSFFVCDKCGYSSHNENLLNLHLKVSKCLEKCEKGFYTKQSKNAEECSFCDIKLHCSDCKSKHIDQDHRKNSTWYCSKCNFKTSSRDTLFSHYRTHKKIFSCETCKETFCFIGQLKNHQQRLRHISFDDKIVKSESTKYKREKIPEILSHGEKQFSCHICSTTRTTLYDLHKHMEIHFKVSCSICNPKITENRPQRHITENHSSQRKLSLRQNLRSKILRSHTANPLKSLCPVCGQLINKRNLPNHVKVCHSFEGHPFDSQEIKEEPDHFTSHQTIDCIKHEPEEQFVIALPE